jgi:hypothetical protein
MTIISLLDLPLALPSDAVGRSVGMQKLTDDLPNYLARCKLCHCATESCADGLCAGQTFEGGISGSPGVEAHGAYAFCALACLSIIGPPEETIARYGLLSDDYYASVPLTIFEVVGPAPASIMAICSAECSGRRILRKNKQACRWMLQPLGGRMLATAAVCNRWKAAVYRSSPANSGQSI